MKPTAQRVREAEAAHRARGEKEIRVWVPNRPDAIAAIRALAVKLCAEANETSNPPSERDG